MPRRLPARRVDLHALAPDDRAFRRSLTDEVAIDFPSASVAAECLRRSVAEPDLPCLEAEIVLDDAQAARGADYDVRAMAEVAAFLRGVHPADAGYDARTGRPIEPDQLAADLQREFAGRRYDERMRFARGKDAIILAEQLGRHGETEGDRLAGSRAGGDDEIPTGGIGFDDGGLDGRRGFVTARGKRAGERRG